MKVVCVGIDALEYKLVKNYDLDTFKQEEYGKVKVPIAKRFGVPCSPQVWTSFLKGKMIKNPIYFKKFKNPLLNSLDKFIDFKPIRNFGKIFFKRNKPVQTKGTIFDEISNSKAISIPCYNEDIKTNDKMRNAYKKYDVEDKNFWKVQLDGLKKKEKKF